MVKQNIQAKIKDLEDKKEKLDKEISSLKIELNNESKNSEWIAIPETDLEVTKEVLHKGKSYNEIMQLKKPDEELLTLRHIGIICEYPELLKTLKMDASSTNDDFFFKQPFPKNKANNYVARFYSSSYWSGLGFRDGADYSYRTLGVRFVRKKGKKVKNV
jgi:hypothetical protein